MKKLFSLLICFIITAGLFTACSDKKAEPAAESSAQTSVETETKTEPKTDIGSTESEQTSKPDNQSPASPAHPPGS